MKQEVNEILSIYPSELTSDPAFLRNVAGTIHRLFESSKRGTQPLSAAIKRMKTTAFGSMMTADQLKKSVHELASRCPEWLTVRQHADGDLLKVVRQPADLQEYLSAQLRL